MRKAGLSLILVFITISVFGQGPVNIGLKFGTNSSAMVTDFDKVLDQNVTENDTVSYLAGIFVRINFGRLYLQPEVYFNTKGGIITPVGNNQFQLSTTTFDYKTIDVPILLGIKVINKDVINLRVHAGPVFSYVTTNDLVSGVSDLSADDLNDRYIGWQFGIGIDAWFLTIDARIENSSNILSSSSPYNAKNRIYLLSAGIKLF